MAKKVYAVRKGRVPGIYYNWDDCRAQVEGFSGAEYKGFPLESDAKKYLDREDITSWTQPEPEPARTPDGSNIIPELPYAFTDGSYNPVTKQAGWGGFLVLPTGDPITLQGAVDDENWNTMRNVAGEICGAMSAIRQALTAGLKSLHIYYDYAGVEHWPDGSWKANKPETQFYRDTVDKARAAGLDIKFHHVAAHTGIPGNELADQLAKQAVGVSV